jgi:ubiquinone/menaquinone biosynthesis C-methylase UbiE
VLIARRRSRRACYFIVMNFSDPRSNVLQMGLRDGMKVGDFGAGSGHFSLAASGVVGASGRVYAIDVQEDVLKHLHDSAQRAGRRNIETIWGNIELPGGSKLRDQSLDAVILSNTLFQLEHKEEVVKEIKRVLNSGGKLLVIDWAGAYGGLGPAPQHVVTEHQAEELFITGGFYKAKDFRAGPHHYAILFTAP